MKKIERWKGTTGGAFTYTFNTYFLYWKPFIDKDLSRAQGNSLNYSRTCFIKNGNILK